MTGLDVVRLAITRLSLHQDCEPYDYPRIEELTYWILAGMMESDTRIDLNKLELDRLRLALKGEEVTR